MLIEPCKTKTANVIFFIRICVFFFHVSLCGLLLSPTRKSNQNRCWWQSANGWVDGRVINWLVDGGGDRLVGY